MNAISLTAHDFQQLLTGGIPGTFLERNSRGSYYYHAATRPDGVKVLVTMSVSRQEIVGFEFFSGSRGTWGPVINYSMEDLKSFMNWSDTYSISALDLLHYFKSR